MLKMIIRFDEDKVRNESEYDLDGIYAYIEEIVCEENLRVCDDERGVYTDNEEGNMDDDLYSFMTVAAILADRDWIAYAKEWLWYEDAEEAQNLLRTFKILRY